MYIGPLHSYLQLVEEAITEELEEFLEVILPHISVSVSDALGTKEESKSTSAKVALIVHTMEELMLWADSLKKTGSLCTVRIVLSYRYSCNTL